MLDRPVRPRRASRSLRGPGLIVLLALLTLPSAALAQVDVCAPTPVADLDGMLDRTEELIALVEYGEALSQLESLESRLPCADAPVASEQLTRMYLYRGVTFFFLGNNESSVREFSAALAIEPNWEWDESLGDRPRTLFDEAARRLEQTSAEPAPPVELASGVEVRVDGTGLISGETLRLIPGTHLLQYRRPSGTWSGRYFTVHPGVPAALPLPPDLLAPVVRTSPTPPVDDDQGAPRPTSDRQRSLYPTLTYSGIGLTAAGVATFSIAGVQWLKLRDEILSTWDQGDADDPELQDALTRSASLARAVNVGLGVAAVGAATTGVSVVLWRRADAQVAVSPLWIPGAPGLALSGRF